MATNPQNTYKMLFFSMLLLFLLAVNGCTAFSVIPITLKEVKDYALGQQRSFGYPLDQVIKASAYELRLKDFSIKRIEKVNQKGFIIAKWKDTTIRMTFESITPKLTKANTKIFGQNSAREFSSESMLLLAYHSVGFLNLCNIKQLRFK